MPSTGHDPFDFPVGTQAVIFDMDGVLIDSWDSTMEFFTRIKRAVGLPTLSREEREFCFIHTVTQSIRHMVPPDKLPAAMRAKEDMDWDALIPLMRIQPGIHEYLDSLRNAGLLLAVDTNGESEQIGILESLDLFGRFDTVVTASDVREGKPSPEGVERILQCFELRPDQAVFIGDSVMDMRAARAASVTFWAYNSPKLKADRHILSYGAASPAS